MTKIIMKAPVFHPYLWHSLGQTTSLSIQALSDELRFTL
jgi:hypothetical protein